MTSPIIARRGRPGYDRDSMLEVVVAAFNERGYDATSLGVIADRLGLSKSAIYHHFDSKEQMLEVALGKALDALEAVFDAPEATSGPVVSRIRYVVRGAVLVLCEQMPFVTLLLRLRGNTPIELEAMRRRREIDRKLGALFELSRGRARCAPTWTRASPSGSPSAWSTPSSSGTAPTGRSAPSSSPTRCWSSSARD